MKSEEYNLMLKIVEIKEKNERALSLAYAPDMRTNAKQMILALGGGETKIRQAIDNAAEVWAGNFAIFDDRLTRYENAISRAEANLQNTRTLLGERDHTLQTVRNRSIQLETGIKSEQEKLSRTNALKQQKQKDYEKIKQATSALIAHASADQKSFVLQKAISAGNSHIVSLFIDTNFNTDFQNASGDSLLHTAIKYDHSELLRRLLPRLKDIDPNKVDCDHRSPLMLATAKGDFALCFNLIKHGADIYIADKTGNSPYKVIANKLFADIRQGQDGFLKALLSLPIDLSLFRHPVNSNSPLYEATVCEQEAISRLLFSPKTIASAVLSAVENDNLNGNMQTCEGIGVIKKLIDRGADRTNFMWGGKPLVFLALKNNNLFIAKLIANADCNKKALFFAIKENELGVIKNLLMMQCELAKEVDEAGLTPLMVALNSGNKEAAKLFKDSGESIGDALASAALLPEIRIDEPLQSHDLILLHGILKSNCTLTSLTLSGVSVTLFDLTNLTAAIKNKPIGSLNLSNNNLGDSAAPIISDFIKSCKLLKVAKFSELGLTAAGMMKIAIAIENSTAHLRELDIANNNLGNTPISAIAIKKIITGSEYLLKLNLAGTWIGDHALLLLLESVTKNRSLIDINLSNNKLGKASLDRLTEALAVNYSLVRIDLSKNSNSEEFQSSLKKLFEDSKLLSVGVLDSYQAEIAELKKLTRSKIESFNKVLMDLANYQPEEGTPLSFYELFTLFKQLQFKVINNKNLFEKIKPLFKKVDNLVAKYEKPPDGILTDEVFLAALEDFKQDHDYMS